MSPSSRSRALAVAALATGLALGLSGCSGGGSAAAPGTGASGAGAAAGSTSGAAASAATGAGANPAASGGTAPAGSPGAAGSNASTPPASSGTASAAAGSGKVTVFGVPANPGCDPVVFVQRANPAVGAVAAYVITPAAKGSLDGKGTAHALAVLHAGQAVRFAAARLNAARQALATCPAVVKPLTVAVDGQIVALRAAAAAFARNAVPPDAVLAKVKATRAATIAAAAELKVVIKDAPPALVQISSS